MFVRGLIEGSPRVIAGISWALTSSRNYPPHLLLEALATPGVSKSAVLEIIAAQKQRFSVRDLLQAAYAQEANEKAALFRIIGEIADAQRVSELIGRLHGKDPIARVHIINILARFNTPEVQTALQAQLKDPNKLIRGAVLSALQRTEGADRCRARVRAAARSGNRRAEQGDRRRHQGEPSRHDPLPHRYAEGRERVRAARGGRGAERGRHRSSVKYLLAAMKDSDWWVRSRAADALGKIGGPKVIEAVLQLVRDKDEDIRRAAIEILNQTKDERAVDELIQATRDTDWWVSERAIDALAEIGSKRALPRLQRNAAGRQCQGAAGRRARARQAR